jgi:transposase
MTEEEAIAFCKSDPEAAAKIILMVGQLEQRIKELEAKCNMDSSNSSKPPSTDNKLTKSKAEPKSPSKRKRGGQHGHKGKRLKMVSHPDHIKVLSPSHCSHCGESLKDRGSVKIEKRQVFDLSEIQMEVTEYQAHTLVCEGCETVNKGLFPKSINASVQYGDKLKSTIGYLHSYQMIPYERIIEMIENLTSHTMATGSIYNFLNSHYDALDHFETELKQVLLKENVVHSDETGVNVKGTLHWIHVASSSAMTYYMLHPQRGRVAMDDMEIIPNYGGCLVHDHWTPYNQYSNCEHSYCNAHLLRELKGITEKDNFAWSKEMYALLSTMNQVVHQAKEDYKDHLSSKQIKKFTEQYEEIIQSAQHCYPPPDPTLKPKRGRPKQDKGKNLLDRFSKYQDETLRFLSDFQVPFTNNQAERDLRMIKVKEKVSGSFASFRGGEIFARIRSYISTLKKNNLPVLHGLRDALNGNPFIPSFVGS